MVGANKRHTNGRKPKAVDHSMLLDSTLGVIAHTLCSGRCSFMLLDHATEELHVGYAKGLSPEVMAGARAKIGESIAGIVASSRQPLLIRNLDSFPDFRAEGLGQYKTKSVISVPVLVDGDVYGVLNVTDRLDGTSFEEHDLVTLNLLSAHLALCVEVSLFHDHIRQMANVDGLTGASNHRFFHERLGEEIERAHRFGQSLSLLMIDVNGFKDYNDRYGHPAGDAVLQQVANTLRECVRQIDVVSRYGGDEFTIILPETDGTGALNVATRVVTALDAKNLDRAVPAGFEPISLSLGVSSYPKPALSKSDLIEQADQAMYIAKRGTAPHTQYWSGSGY